MRKAEAVSANDAQHSVLTFLFFTRLPSFLRRGTGLVLFAGEAPDEQLHNSFAHHFVVARLQIGVAIPMAREEGDGFEQIARGRRGINDGLKISALYAATQIGGQPFQQATARLYEEECE